MGRLEGKVALITGAARGTGAEIANLFVAEGAQVVACDVNDDRGAETIVSLGDRARYRHLDVTQETEWAATVDEVRQQEGRLDVLVNNAGVLHLSTIDDTTLETFETVLRVNTVGAFLGIKACLPLLRQSGQGSIVNIASVNGLGGFPGVGAYTASKFALRGLTRVAALENGHLGVRVNCVCPLAGNPEMHVSLVGRPPPPPPQATGERSAPALRIPMRGGKGSLDVAQAALFLASDESSFCSGTDLVVDGGMNAGAVFDIPGVFTRPT